jgi:hypothetical protein
MNKVIFIIILLIFSKSYAKCCECDSISLKAEIIESDFLFIGEVIKVNKQSDITDIYGRPYGYTKVMVKKIFKGELPSLDTITIVNMVNVGCEYQFLENKNYLIFITRNANCYFVHASICSRTKLLEESKKEIQFLESKEGEKIIEENKYPIR